MKDEDYPLGLCRDVRFHPRRHDDIGSLEAIEWGPLLNGDAA